MTVFTSQPSRPQPTQSQNNFDLADAGIVIALAVGVHLFIKYIVKG